MCPFPHIRAPVFSAAMRCTHKYTGKNNTKPDIEKLSACAFVPCPMATCALKCAVVSAINLLQLVYTCSYNGGWQYDIIS